MGSFNKTGQTKRLLALLGKNDCCLQPGSCPTLSPDSGNILECRENGLYATASGGGDPMRFGVSGEDGNATQDRTFTMSNNQLAFMGNGRLMAYWVTNTTDGAVNSLLRADNGVNNAGYAQMIVSADAAGAPAFDIRAQGVANDSVVIQGFLNRLLFNIAADSVVEWDGIDQDNASTMMLALNGSNQMVWVDKSTIGGAGGLTAADNGLSVSGTTAKLGGTLLANTAIHTAAFGLTIDTATANVAPLTVNSANASAISASIASGASPAIFAYTPGANGQAIRGFADLNGVNYGGTFGIGLTGASQVASALAIDAQFGTPSGGIGVGFDFRATTDSTSIKISNRLISQWTTIADAGRTSLFSIIGVDTAVDKTLLTVSGAGIFTLVQGLQNFTDDTAAAGGGIPVNGLYRTASAVKIRVV